MQDPMAYVQSWIVASGVQIVIIAVGVALGNYISRRKRD